VRWQVLRHGLVLATVGVGMGIAGALFLTRLLQRLLFGVAPNDWITFATVALILSSAAILASYVPARRATRADPLSALRAE
jgi:ABC-type antimicrobial peptide transport system permease subunit